MEENKENLFAVIPHIILVDNTLTPLERLLFGEIMALTNKEGYCWASNQYLAELFEVDSKTISRSISKLKERKLINVEILDHYLRKIFLVQNHIFGGVTKRSKGLPKNVKGVGQKSQGGVTKLSTYNNNYKDNYKDNKSGFDAKASRNELAKFKKANPLKDKE